MKTALGRSSAVCLLGSEAVKMLTLCTRPALGIPGQPGLRCRKAIYKNKNCASESIKTLRRANHKLRKKCQLIFKR